MPWQVALGAVAVAGAGIVFVILLGWRLIPVRERTGVEGFETGTYLTEARVPEDSKTVGMTLGEVEDNLKTGIASAWHE